MRVLTVGSMYPPHHLGGYELLWQGAVRHLRAAGHTVVVLSSDHRQAGAGEEQDADVHRELRWYWRENRFPRLTLGETLRLERHNSEVLERHLARLNPDVVGWWAMGGMSMSLLEQVRRRSLPAVGFVIDDWLIYGPQVDAWSRATRRARPLHRLLERATGLPARVDLAGAADWLFASEATRAGTLRHRLLSRTEVAHCGIDGGFLVQAHDQDWAWRLLYVGRIDPRKGIDTAIESLVHLPEQATLRVVGDGDLRHRAELGALAERLGVAERVSFEGPRPRPELPRIYSDADAVVFPVRWEEPWGLVPLEAMARRRPVVATGSGGSGEYLRDGDNCLLFAGGDAAQLAGAVRRLAADPGLRGRLADGGLDTARRHTDGAFHERVEQALQRACRVTTTVARDA